MLGDASFEHGRPSTKRVKNLKAEKNKVQNRISRIATHVEKRPRKATDLFKPDEQQ